MKRALLTDLFSTLRQKDLSVQNQLSIEDVAGLARFEILFFGRLVIPDSHLFDGSLLLDMFTPAKFAEACAHTPERPTVEVRLRSSTFDRSLLDWMRDPQTKQLRPLELRYLRDDDLERRIAESLQRPTHVSDNRSAKKELARVLADNGVPKDRVKSQRDAWKRWASEAVDLRLFRDWPTAPYPLLQTVANAVLDPATFATEEGVKAYEEIVGLVEVGDTRSASADAVLRKYFGHGGGPPETLDESTLREWYHDCRQVALAKQHNCDLSSRPAAVQTLVEAILGSADPEVATYSTSEVDAVRRMVYVLSEMTASEFGKLLETTSRSRRYWLGKRTRKSLADHIDAVLSQTRPGKAPEDKPWYAQERIILPTSSAIAGSVMGGLATGAPIGGVVGGLITVGLTMASTKVRDIVGRRGDHRALVRWIATSSES